jgi:hypothetical protein
MEKAGKHSPRRRVSTRRPFAALLTAAEAALDTYAREGRLDFSAEQELEVAIHRAKQRARRSS